jgi:hypothetical protein
MWASDEARLELSKCTVASKKEANFEVKERSTVILTDCTIANSLKTGLHVLDAGMHLSATRSTLQCNGPYGVCVADSAGVHLEECTAARNKAESIYACYGGYTRDPHKMHSC